MMEKYELMETIEQLRSAIEDLQRENAELLLTIREIYASLCGEREREMQRVKDEINGRKTSTEAEAEHRQKYHGWRRAASRVQDICLAHGIDPKSEE